MPPQLDSLPAELILHVARLLVEDDDPIRYDAIVDNARDQATSTSEAAKDHDRLSNKSPCPASKVDLRNPSRTCKWLYTVLTPQTFRSMTLRNTNTSAAAVHYLMTTDKINHVETLHFVG